MFHYEKKACTIIYEFHFLDFLIHKIKYHIRDLKKLYFFFQSCFCVIEKYNIYKNVVSLRAAYGLKVLGLYKVRVSGDSLISLLSCRFSIKGQLISKPIYDLLTSPKKRTDEFDLFAFLLFTANKSNSSVRFFGEVSRS